MNNWIFVLAGIAVAILGFTLIIFESPAETSSVSIYDAGFTYYDIEKIQTALAQKDIFVSAPTAITDRTIDQYCTFFEEDLQRTVEYCTTTVVTDIEGNPLGNINIGGDTNSPILAIVNLETPTLESDPDKILAVIETVIETLVCDCWDEDNPGDFGSVSDWMDAVQDFYYESDGRNVKSTVDNLGDFEIFLEITPLDNSVLQTLVILK